MKTQTGPDDTPRICYFDNYYSNLMKTIPYYRATPQRLGEQDLEKGKNVFNRGAKVEDIANNIWWQNYNRLLVWLNVGRRR